MLVIKGIKTEYMQKPLGIDERQPRFSWWLQSEDRDVRQVSHRITVSAGEEVVWDATEGSDNTVHIVYGGKPLKSRTRYSVAVEVTDNYANKASARSWFETGLFKEDWQATWIEAEHRKTKRMKGGMVPKPKKGDPGTYLSSPTVFVRDFEVDRIPVSARLYITAHGVYRFRVNGVLTDDRYFAPEFTPYDKWITYQTYDITRALIKGTNTLEVTVADGWYAGCVGLTGATCSYGDTHALLLQMELTFGNGKRVTVTSDKSFRAGNASVLYADSFIGEKRDLRVREFRENLPVYERDYGVDALTAQEKEPVRIWKEVPATRIFTDTRGETIVDFGQNLAGIVKFTIQAEEGREVGLEHSEVLNENGAFIMNVAGMAKQYDAYILPGDRVTVQPEFTYHGFRYVRLINFPPGICVEDFTALALSSATEETAHFECSDARLNRLWANTIWSQRANMLSIPTDCPQREKAGWTGDIQVYAATAVQNTNCDAFLSGWLKAAAAEQLEKGEIPIIVPYLRSYHKIGALWKDTSAAWGDAIEVVPYRLYKAYADTRVLQTAYPAICRWLGYIETRAATKSPLKYKVNPRYWFNRRARALQACLWNTGIHFGDWLIPSKSANGTLGMALSVLTRELVVPCYYVYALQTSAAIADVLGKRDDAARFRATVDKVKEAFRYFYVRKDGTIKTKLQGVYVLALEFGMLDERETKIAADTLAEMIHRNGDRLDTGFASIGFLMDTLCAHGKADVAYKLLYQEQCPSWLYEVNNGATTIWESWKAVNPDGKVTDVSYNHYCFGCVGDWMYRHIAGVVGVEPGYKRFLVQPHPDCGLTHACLQLKTVYGPISVRWETRDGIFNLKVTVPANTSAEIRLPDAAVVPVGSGDYEFECGVANGDLGFHQPNQK